MSLYRRSSSAAINPPAKALSWKLSLVSLPVKSNLCPRFPTELVLRKTSKVGVSVSIIPDHFRNEAERISLAHFCETLDGVAALPELIEKAKTAIAIGSCGRAFLKAFLRIEISGPDRPHLLIVDLPGLIHSEIKQQSMADVELVQDVLIVILAGVHLFLHT
ncbi:hypothetical protein BKA63DRAFT_564729 [Paraphoma chrysanthemicola]|nr:hypothetical protein BKA63DRAFT_564729 [Paraphoma chrysanthemicola]